MPDPYERHGRAQGWDRWGPNPSRSQQRAAAAADDPAKTGTPSKRKRGECKGPDGWHEKHDLVFVIQPERFHVPASKARKECDWVAVWSIRNQQYEPGWGCLHSQVCSRCEHREREHWDMTRVLCPSYTGPEQHPVPQEVLDEVARRQAEREAREARWRARYRPRHPVIKGRQGYRKPKGGDS